MVQASPQLEGVALLSSEVSVTGLRPASLQAAREQWSKADTYYYLSIARMQRLWEVRPSPPLPHAFSLTDKGQFMYQAMH